jgi:hypothetical protein
VAQVAVCFEINTKHINRVGGQNVKLLNVKPLNTEIYLSFFKVPVRTAHKHFSSVIKTDSS